VATAQPGRATVIRAKVMHVPRDPFRDGGTLECHENGAVAFRDGRIVATADATEVTSEHPEAELLDERDSFLLPGFVDTHVHWAQLGVIGAMGLELLEWLSTRTLPGGGEASRPRLREAARQGLRPGARRERHHVRARLRLPPARRAGGLLRGRRGERAADRERAGGVRPRPSAGAPHDPGGGL
jgi:hypothetical protein